MKPKIFLVWVASVWFAASAIAQNLTQQVTAIQYYFDTEPGLGVAGNGAIVSVTPTGNLNQSFAITLPGSLNSGFHEIYVRAKDEFGRWSIAERRLFYIANTAETAANLVAYQYYFDTDPGVDIAGNGAIVSITPTTNYSSSIGIALPGSLNNGFHSLYVRVKDDLGRWSIIERRLFFITNTTTAANITAYQYYFDTDPGVGVIGNGAVVSITPTDNYNSAIAITLPGSLNNGFHNLYVRVKDDQGRWSIIERRLFFITNTTNAANLTAYQYYFDTDPGVGTAGNGAVVSITPTTNYNSAIAITLPNSLSSGFHNLYVRVKDELGRWSIIERRLFFITNTTTAANLTAYQYYFDTDPGVGVAGNGAVVSITPTTSYSSSIAITLPGSLGTGFHNLYVRMKDDQARWSIIERRLFYISDAIGAAMNIVKLEYYFDTDPGVGNGNPYPITATSNFNATIDLGVPCLSSGGHKLYLRAKDNSGRWSIIERASFTVTGGIAQASVSPSGPITICSGDYTVLSTIPVSGVGYQWTLNGSPINGATDSSYSATAAGDYALRAICGNSFSTSNSVTVTVQALITFYADVDGDTYGNPSSTTVACTQPTGYATGNTDCNDNNSAVHPGATEVCNLIDDDCDGSVDEGVQLTFYRDADTDGFGDIASVTLACTTPSGYVSDHTDCNDGNLDINPGATEVCNLIDDDCDGSIDENVQLTFYADNDHDGFGNPLSTTLACTAPSNYVSDNLDCNDANMNVHPGATEVCDGIDDDCDGLIDDSDPSITGQLTWFADSDNDGYGNAASSTFSCSQPSGYVSNDDDCDDVNVNVNPGSTEVCNGTDDDCDGLADDLDPSVTGRSTWYADVDGDGYGDASSTQPACTQPSGYTGNGDDCDDEQVSVNPGATEVCNLIDDDCDASIDEGMQLTFYRDADADSYGDVASSTLACMAPSGYVDNNTDCNDVIYSIYPGATETCNATDDDCDGMIDEGFTYSVAATSINSSVGNNFCLGTSTLLSVTGGTLGTSADWKWYEGGCGNGSSIGTGTSISVTPSAGANTYYVRAEGTCNSSACISISLTVNTAPSFTTCPSVVTGNTDPLLCSAIKNYSVNVLGTPLPNLTYSFTGATSGTGNGSGIGSAFNEGTTSVHINADNVCGSASCDFNVIISDHEPPHIAECPDNIASPNEDDVWGAHVTWDTPTITDNCVVSSVTSDRSPGDFFLPGTSTVTYTATDIHGNTSTCSFDVTVGDPPVLPPLNISVFANDIQFSNPNPNTSDIITVSATIHNYSSQPADNFIVHLINQYNPTEVYSDYTITHLGAQNTTQVSWQVLAPASPSFVPMQVVIDYTDVLDEDNELDNSAVRPFVTGDFSVGGSIVVVAHADPETSEVGSHLQICGNAIYINTAIPLGDSSVAGAAVTIHIQETNEILHVATNSNGDFCASYTAAATPGVYHFTAEVTDFTLTGDTDATFTLVPAVITCPVDITVTLDLAGPFLCNHPFHITKGQSITPTIHVQNGCSPITDITFAHIAISGGPAPLTVQIPPLASGEVYDVTFAPATINTSGLSTVAAIVDYGDYVTESNETNNVAVKIVNVHPDTADIVPVYGGLAANYECEAGVISFIIENQGGVATGDFEVTLNVDSNNVPQTTSNQTVSSIPAQCSTTIVFNILLVDGSYHFVLDCDPSGIVTEISDANNTYSFTKQIGACGVDLVVYGCGYLDVKPTDPFPPSSIVVQAVIGNEGLLPVTHDFDVQFTADVTPYTVHVTTDIPAGGNITVTSPSIPQATTGNPLTVFADAAYEITENESNNTSSGILGWDFELTSLNYCEYPPTLSTTGNICSPSTFKVWVWNHGLYEASSLQTKFELSGPGLPSGWNNLGTVTTFIDNTCQCPVTILLPSSVSFPQAGTYQLRMTGDYNNTYPETDETNNVLILTIVVSETADYAEYSQYISPSLLNPGIGQPITFDITYKNQGCTGTTPIELALEIDEVLHHTMTVGALNTNQFSTVSIPNSFSSNLPGVHVARAIIDNQHQITEVDELNNEATRAFIVGLRPDFHPDQLTASNLNPSQGELINISAVVTNLGEVSGTGTVQFLALVSNQESLITEMQVTLDGGEAIGVSTDWVVTDPSATIIVRALNVDPEEFDLTNNEATLQLNPLSVQLTAQNVSCNGLNDGVITATPVGGTGPYLFVWNNGYNGSPVQVGSGTYSVVVTDVNGLTATASATVDQDECGGCSMTVNIIATGSTTVCQPNCVLLTATASGGSGMVSYQWNPNGETDDSIDACFSGNYSVIATDENGCSADTSIDVTVHARPSCNIDPIAEASLPIANSNNNQLCATTLGGATYSWTLTSSDNSWYIEGSANGLCINYHCGSFGSSATFTFITTSSNGCNSDACALTISPEAHEVCSYTQGFYGNTNGQLTCISKTAPCAVKQALGWNDQCTAVTNCNPIVVGYGNTKKITIDCSQATCVTAKLPAGSSAAILPAGGPWTCSNVPNTLLQNGRFKNVLLGQAIALTINIRLFPGLANLHLTSPSFTTYQSADCDPNSDNIVANSGLTFSIPQSVINCLGTNSNTNKVSNLLGLANLALAGQPYGCQSGSPSLADITNAIDAVNNGFDRCRIISGFNIRSEASTDGLEHFSFSYYPNPTSGITKALFIAPENGKARMDIYTANGKWMTSIFNEEVEQNETYEVEFDTSPLEAGAYLIRMTVGYYSAYAKLIVVR